MLIRVTQNKLGSPDGRMTIFYEAGRDYEMPFSLAEVFIREGWGHADVKPEEQPEVKAAEEPEGGPKEKPLRRLLRKAKR